MRRGNKKVKNSRVDTLIGQQTELHGNISFTGGLHIDGKIKGNVMADGDHASTLILSDKGTIEGEVRAPFLIINGLVIGDLYADETVELAPNARITGNVYYEKIEVAMGAEVNGSLVHVKDAPAQKQHNNPLEARDPEHNT